MTFSKLLPFLCAVVAGALCFAARAEDTDNPAQAAARMALAKQLFEPSAQQATNAPTAETNAMLPANSKEAQAKADQAAAKAQADQAEQQQRAALAAALAQRTNAEAPVKDASSTAPQATTNSWASAPSTESESKPAAQTKKEKKHKKEKPAPPAQAPQPASPADNTYLGQDLGMKPIAAPAVPISASKQQRLAALLQKYEADQITPDEYHQQRAAILAEP
jgi:deoxyribodipyrimidine photolyase